MHELIGSLQHRDDLTMLRNADLVAIITESLIDGIEIVGLTVGEVGAFLLSPLEHGERMLGLFDTKSGTWVALPA